MKTEHLRALMGLAFITVTSSAWAVAQVVSAFTATADVQSGASVSVRVQYDLAEAESDSRLSGLGIRLHFNSHRLRFVAMDDVLQAHLIGMDAAPVDDREDADHDPATDKFLQVAWVDIQGDWPGTAKPPLDLLVARFVALPGRTARTTVRISHSGGAAGATFRTAPVQILIR